MTLCKVIAWLDYNNNCYIIKNFLHNKWWDADTNLAHIEPPPIPLVKETPTGKSDGYYLKLKLRIYPTSSTPELYEFIMSLFDHGKPEEFLLFVENFQMSLAAMGTLETEAGVQYLHTIACGEVLRQFELLPAYMENTDTHLDVDYLMKVLAWYPPPIN